MGEVNGKESVAGSVKWFSEDKGYGFLQLSPGVDVFVHANQLKRSGIERALKEGEKVRFSTEKGPKGSFAINISVVE